MQEPLTRMIDRLRQRHLSDQEITRVARSGRRMEHGCAVLEKLAEKESDLLEGGLAGLPSRYPALNAERPEAVAMLRDGFQRVLRQAGLAMAIDDTSRLGESLCEMQPAYWEGGLDGALVERAFEDFRDGVAESLGEELGTAFDAFLEPAARFFSQTAAVGVQRQVIVDALMRKAAAHGVGGPLGGTPTIDPALRRHIEWLLLHCLRGVLPDGEDRLHDALRFMYTAMRRGKVPAGVVRRVAAELPRACREVLDPVRATHFLRDADRMAAALIAAADVAEKGEAILQRSVEELYEKHPDRRPDEEGLAKTRRDERLILEHSLRAVLPGGREALVDVMVEFHQTLRRFDFGAAFIGDAYRILLENCRRALADSAGTELLAVLERAVAFVSVSADMADGSVIGHVVGGLEKRYPDLFAAGDEVRPLVECDQEQTLFNLGLHVFPSAQWITAGRFTVFGESMADGFYDADMMGHAFDLLEEGVQKMSRASQECVLPSLRRLRLSYDAVLELAEHGGAIVDAASQQVGSRHDDEVKRFERGVEKVGRDLRTMLRTVALSQVPGGEWPLQQGLADFYDSIVEGRMSAEMLHRAYDTLGRESRSRLSAHTAEWMVPRIHACRDMAFVAASIGKNHAALLDAAAESVLARIADTEKQPGGRRRIRHDLATVLRSCALTLAPGADEERVEGMLRLARGLEGSGLGGDPTLQAYRSLREAVADHAGADALQKLAPALDTVIESLGRSSDPRQQRSALGSALSLEMGNGGMASGEAVSAV